MIAQLYFYWPSEDDHEVQPLILLLGSLTFPVVTYYSLFFFVSLGWMVKSMLDILGEKITFSYNQGWKSNYWRNQLKIWKRQYYLISELVYSIDESFGPFLLIVVTNAFIGMIHISFSFLNVINSLSWETSDKANSYMFGLYLIEFVTTFIVITYIPNKIHQTVCQNS